MTKVLHAAMLAIALGILAASLFACADAGIGGLVDGDESLNDGDVEDDGDRPVADGDWEADGEVDALLPDGDMSDGEKPEGDETDGDETDGDETDGDETDGDETDGDETDGDETDGDETDGDETDGDETDGDETDGDESDGDETDGDESDGDATDGDESDGDATDGDASAPCPECGWLPGDYCIAAMAGEYCPAFHPESLWISGEPDVHCDFTATASATGADDYDFSFTGCDFEDLDVLGICSATVNDDQTISVTCPGCAVVLSQPACVTDGDWEEGDLSCKSNADCAQTDYCYLSDCDDEDGTCTPRPDQCSNLFDPVCGCDGETYDNACLAALSGVNVDYKGACLPDTCFGNGDCEQGWYCYFEECALETGLCVERPGDCPDLLDPVCGCDGETYTNACFAAMAGQSVDFDGPCPQSCSVNDECAAEEYCRKDTGDCSGQGICAARPEICMPLYDPVCGCDGITYANDCVAAVAGVNVFAPGVCPDDGCLSNEQCDAADYCLFDDCDDEQGSCTTRPTICPDVWDPVCGCDGVTYSNSCYAAKEGGVTVDYGGACAPPACFGNGDCAEGEYCYLDDCAQETGECRDRPSACPDVWDPVCGCDGNTYANACFAAAAGVSVAYDGACPTPCDGPEDCAASDYCDQDDGACHSEGVCSERPSNCPDVWDPVCGCDGVTYSNFCYAAKEGGVSVDVAGQCQSVVCHGNGDCGSGEYCRFDGCAAESGVCEERPTECSHLWDPVCGCDGETYANACYAAMAGESVDFEGECPTPCRDSGDCGVESYCAKPVGDCAAHGLCNPRPSACPDVWDPVCGCDGETYANDCDAAMAGTSVDYAGECVPTSCFDNTDCGNEDYCLLDDCDAETGVCRERPTLCPLIWDPVCGCDGQTYMNACTAAYYGVSVDYEGECQPPYCWDNDMCADSEYCHYSNCGLEMGECVERPTRCLDIYDPVCGCDGQTYANACYAAYYGMSVDYAGECESISCFSNYDCYRDQYCLFDDCAQETGACETRPTACPDIYDPVCGCNDETYENDCFAAMAGVSVDREGPCNPIACGADTRCPSGSYCDYAECWDIEGVCEPFPTGCTYLWDPVCGCNGSTYSNPCLAAQAGVSVDYTGECIDNECFGGAFCPRGYYCMPEACNQFPGACIQAPSSCNPLERNPVCGCDGETYQSPCYAAMAAQKVDYVGACEP